MSFGGAGRAVPEDTSDDDAFEEARYRYADSDGYPATAATVLNPNQEPTMSDELFNVCQFFPDGTYEYHSRNLPAKEAVEAMKRCTETVGARIGTTARVIVTDWQDCTVAEWQFGKGVTFPTPEMRTAAPAPDQRNADKIDGYDRDDLGESPDF